MQQDTNERGRSLTEMLGVLAVIGVLSIGGIQGYRYAMNKYRANNVLNEINMASHQLSTILLTSMEEQKVISLGNPYDNGTIRTENYPFDYGCGNYDSLERACQQAEEGYWMTIGGIEQNLCQNILSNSEHLPYFVEQRLNEETVTDDSICEEDNEIMLLFNSNGSGELAPDVSNKELTDVDCPINTSVDGLGGYAVTEMDKISGKMMDCHCTKMNTKYDGDGICVALPEKCKSNNDCNKGDYCDITSYGSSNCMTNTTSITGICRNAKADIRPAPSNNSSPFIVSEHKMMWWGAKNFCQALKKTLVEVNDFECAHSICRSGCTAKSGYCHEDTSISVSTKSSTNISPVMQELKKAFSSTYGWTNSSYTSCNPYFVYFFEGYIYTNGPNRTHPAICK